MTTQRHPSYGFGATAPLPFDEAIARATSIDVKATMKHKLNVAFERYTTLGAYNPPLAHRALTLEPDVGLLLPCNVVLREVPGKGEQPQTRIQIADPVAMLGMVQNPQVQDLAREAKARLQRVIAALTSM